MKLLKYWEKIFEVVYDVIQWIGEYCVWFVFWQQASNMNFLLITIQKFIQHHKSRWQFIKRLQNKKVCSYILQYPILRIAQNALRFTSLTDLFNQTLSQLLSEASSHMPQLMREGCSYIYPPLSGTHLYSCVNWSYVEWTNLPKVLTPQHRIRTWVLLDESPKLYPWATALYTVHNY